MHHQKGKARTGRAALSASHKLNKLFTQSLHFRDLLRRVIHAAIAAALAGLLNLSMAGQHIGNPCPQPATGLVQQQVDILITDPQIPVAIAPGREQVSANTVSNRIPFHPPCQPEVATKAKPETHQGADQPNGGAVSVDPSEKFSVLHWLSFWALAFLAGAAVGSLLAPRD